MATAVLMPKLDQSMTEATIVKWKKAVGEAVKKGDVLVTIETETSEVDVEAEQDGWLLAIQADPEEIVSCGATIAWIGQKGEKV